MAMFYLQQHLLIVAKNVKEQDGLCLLLAFSNYQQHSDYRAFLADNTVKDGKYTV